MAKKQVIVTVPVYRSTLSSEEEVSLRHLMHFLRGYDLVLVAPKSLRFSDSRLNALSIVRFADEYFSGIPGYNRLMLSCDFYERFKAYEYILIYQLDCLVFSNDLKTWCTKGWDYVGAPWFKGFLGDTSEGFWAVGNGGLSLRRVASFLKVLRSRRLMMAPAELGEMTSYFPDSPRLRSMVSIPKTFLHACGYKNTMKLFVEQFQQHEDIFWSFHAIRAMPGFKIPPPEEAVQFAFEYAPRFCFEQNKRRLPFGCHAWQKVDAEFWKSSIIKESVSSGKPIAVE